MADTSKARAAFVRHDTLPQQPPPVSEAGVVGWMQKNLFNGWFNSVLTLVAILLLYLLIKNSYGWFFNGVWQASSLSECREILEGKTGACFAVLRERLGQLLFGFQYPIEERWRLIVAFVLLGLLADLGGADPDADLCAFGAGCSLSGLYALAAALIPDGVLHGHFCRLRGLDHRRLYHRCRHW